MKYNREDKFLAAAIFLTLIALSIFVLDLVVCICGRIK